MNSSDEIRQKIDAPFPWMGGKSRVAGIVWEAFGDVPNFVEPFFGSGAVLLGRPHRPKIETVNDADALLANFWRATKAAPDEVAEYADRPVNECDLHARHLWLVEHRGTITARLHGDPEYYDAKLAGWWVWGCCAWIGGGWCSGNGPWGAAIDADGHRQLVHLGGAGQGIKRQLVHLGAGQGINRQLVHLGAGQGINRQLVHLGAGQGINRKRVHLGAGQGINRKLVSIAEWFTALADRLRRVRVCCGDWTRVMGPTPTEKHGVTGIFLDPPYGIDATRSEDCYAIDSQTVAHDVFAWCMENGGNPMLRIALCGYDGEHNALTDHGWRVKEWKAVGGYGSQGTGAGRKNSRRERIWFSPACIVPRQSGLFD